VNVALRTFGEGAKPVFLKHTAPRPVKEFLHGA